MGYTEAVISFTSAARRLSSGRPVVNSPSPAGVSSLRILTLDDSIQPLNIPTACGGHTQTCTRISSHEPVEKFTIIIKDGQTQLQMDGIQYLKITLKRKTLMYVCIIFFKQNEIIYK